VSKETYYSVKRDLLQCQKRPTTMSKETCYSTVTRDGALARPKETYYSVKRDLLQCQKRPATVPSHETAHSQGQKRPTTVSKETYYSVKRDLLQYRHTRRRTRKASRAGLNLNLKTLNPGPKTGVHARRTRNASPVGDLFKKACDNIGCVFVVLTVLR
jgi:hypothetical protein